MRRQTEALDGDTAGPLGPSPARDRDLQVVRRLDWRFLLPEPRLRRVACLGCQDAALLAALKTFSDSLAVLSRPEGPVPPEVREHTFDLVVAGSPHRPVLERAATLLAPGGHLYCEIDRAAWFRSTGRGRSPSRLPGFGPIRAVSAMLRRLGLDGIRIHWHHPDFEACQRIIPLREPEAVAYLFARDCGRTVRPIAWEAGRHMAGTGLLPLLVPCVSIIARRHRDLRGAP